VIGPIELGREFCEMLVRVDDGCENRGMTLTFPIRKAMFAKCEMRAPISAGGLTAKMRGARAPTHLGEAAKIRLAPAPSVLETKRSPAATPTTLRQPIPTGRPAGSSSLPATHTPDAPRAHIR
jgi:hypothetical protein